MSPDLVYQIALTLIPQIGPVCARQLLEHFGEARAVFHSSAERLRRIDGVGEIRIQAIRNFNRMQRAEQELRFVSNNNITALSLLHPEYPKRLLNCPDAPTLLYRRGGVSFNTSKVVAVIGTRSHTTYGKKLAEQFIAELAAEDILVISGLAFGIDALAHKLALQHGLKTAGVLAHGLDQLYPAQHAALAQDMLQNGGGLLTEFMSSTQPDRHHFPARNRIVAGMSDAIVVVETGEKGGSLITAELANGYNRDVFAFPGRVNDARSTGCNDLIRQNKAALIRSAADMISYMNWNPATIRKNSQRTLFPELNPDEKKVAAIINESGLIGIDELNWKTGLSNSQVAAAILGLELKNVIVSLPGKLYRRI